MTGRRAALLAAAACAVAAAAPARAEGIVASLSQTRITIDSDFTGAELVVFGVIERDAATVSRPGGYDVVVVVRGPREAVVTRRKDRFLGIWVTRESRTFSAVPSFYALASTRLLDRIADPRILAENDIGLAYADFGERSVSSDDPFRQALVRLKTSTRLFVERTGSVEMLTPTFFRATLPLPAIVPDGGYTVETVVFSDGARVASRTLALTVEKVGFEERVHRLAFDEPLVYGLGVVALALVTGWLGGVVFRRD